MLASLFLAVTTATLATAHTIITYPGWRGNNLHQNESWPYGMQWIYPCKRQLSLSLSLSVLS
jgi:hypothetical protein